jgi:hypothetical protein
MMRTHDLLLGRETRYPLFVFLTSAVVAVFLESEKGTRESVVSSLETVLTWRAKKVSLRPVFALVEADWPEVSREPQGDFSWQRRTCSVAQSSWSCSCLPSDRLACSE